MKKIISKLLGVVISLSVAAGGLSLSACSEKANDGTGVWVDGSFIAAEGTSDEKSIDYSVFVPDYYDGSEALPLLTFMGDSTTLSKSTDELHGYVDEEGDFIGGEMALLESTSVDVQKKYPSFVMVIALPATGIGTGSTAAGESGVVPIQYAAYAPDIVTAVCQEYNIDTDRLYLTGQSAGAMNAFELNYRNPNFFAATYYVAASAVWDGRVYDTIQYQNFAYCVSANANEYTVRQDLIDLFDENGVSYSMVEVSAKAADEEEANQAMAEMFAEGNHINLITFAEGTIGTVTGTGLNSAAHMATWRSDPGAYTFMAVWDWLFSQTKPTTTITTTYTGDVHEMN